MNDKLDESNKGHQLLRKMGWGGAGLGAKEQGIEAPINAGEVFRTVFYILFFRFVTIIVQKEKHKTFFLKLFLLNMFFPHILLFFFIVFF